MQDGKGFGKFIKNNRGASLLVVLAAFVVLLVVALNVMMMVSAGNGTTLQEYETEQAQLYLLSVYSVLNGKMVEGTWQDAFIEGETVSIEVSGFQENDGAAIPVIINVTRTRNRVEVEYLMTYRGKQYSITAQYLFKNVNGIKTITLRSCQELIQL